MKEKQNAEYNLLVKKALDCGVCYGIYSKKYADAIRAMNDYWLIHHTRTVKELYIEIFNETKIKVERWIHRNS